MGLYTELFYAIIPACFHIYYSVIPTSPYIFNVFYTCVIIYCATNGLHADSVP